jgi:thiamine kinase-like enzyme
MPYSLLGTIDISGDGTDEVILERVEYEGISFEIYEYKMVNSIAFSAGKGTVVEVVFQEGKFVEDFMPNSTLKSSFPEAKLEAVETALQTAFNTRNVESIQLLTGGFSSALVYKITVNGKAYVLRLIMQIDPLSDPVRQYACMNMAAEAGISPQVYYFSTEDALAITDFIEAVPLSKYVGSRDDLLAEFAKMIESIHATSLFPKFVNFMDGIDGFIREFKASKVLPETATAEVFKYYSEIQMVYPRHDRDLVSSHNDLNPHNILFDGKKFWVIDWEGAFGSDRYVDLAIVANSFVTTEKQENIYLKAYFGDALDDCKRDRFFLMQQVCHIFYALPFMKFAAALRPPNFVHDSSMDTPGYRQFCWQLGAGEVSLNSYEGKLLFGKVLLNEALHNMKTARFVRAIEQMA